VCGVREKGSPRKADFRENICMSAEEAAAVRLFVPSLAREAREGGGDQAWFIGRGMEMETKRNKAAIDAPLPEFI